MINYYQIGTPATSGTRKLYPIIRVSDITYCSGFWVYVNPVALLIEELGKWSFVAIEDGITEEIIHDIPSPEKV